MNDEFRKDDELNTLGSLDAKADDLDDIDLDSLKLEFLDRSAPVSNARKSASIEELREKVAQSNRTIAIGDFNGKKRVAIQRNGIRLAMTVFENEMGLTDDKIRELFRRKIRRGDFDREITVIYAELWSKQKH